MRSEEKLPSRLGFTLISVGCAVGLGNVWRFLYITGQYGGAAFVLFYLVFLILLGLPITVMGLSVGRVSQRSAAKSFDLPESEGTKWYLIKYACMGSNYLPMMLYATVGGWMINYCLKMASGTFEGLRIEQVDEAFSNVLTSPGQNLFWMITVTVIGLFIHSGGLRNGVEKTSKYIMPCLPIVMLVLTIRTVTLSNAVEGLKSYPTPDFQKMITNGSWDVIFAAIGQAFLTLNLGIDTLAIFGSHIGKDRSLLGESLSICILDICVAFIAGLIIFLSCFSFNVAADNGPGPMFATLPNVFNIMSGGRLWGFLSFLFMSFVTITAIIAVFENTVAFTMDSG